jgi:hypothetical protein
MEYKKGAEAPLQPLLSVRHRKGGLGDISPNSFVIAIPSYDRPQQIQAKTLKYLKECGIDDDKITVFVANAQQEEAYITAGVKHKIVIGELGITNQRNFIMNYFPLEEYIISMDDDIERLERKVGDVFQPITDLTDTIQQNYQLMLEENRFIWGIYPVHNVFFIRTPIHTDLKFIIGVCYGFINRRIMLDIEYESKEDVENSLLHYLKDGGVLRVNTIVVKTKFNAVGGLGKERHEANKAAAEALHAKYPTLTKIFQRKNGTYEIRFKKLLGI